MGIDLSKKKEKLAISLAKKKIASVRMQVATVVDRSGSMDELYRDGTVQEYMERLVPVGLKFDDNGQIDNWAFHTRVYQTGPVNESNLDGFVRKEIESISSGGTSYAPPLEEVLKHYFVNATPTPKKGGFLRSLFGAKEDTQVAAQANTVDPVYVIFQTDGANDDRSETDRVLGQLAKHPIYVQFVGIGNERHFDFIKEMGDKYDHVGFIHINDLRATSDETLYDLLISDELKNFLQTRFPNNITLG